jgi:hypothetical protein
MRFALPIDVFGEVLKWSYSGAHLFEIRGLNGGTPQLEFKGAIKTAEANGTDPFPAPPYVVPRRTVMHDDAVFVVDGATLIGRQWDGVTQF